MKTIFSKIEVGDDFFVYLSGHGKLRFNKISARKAKAFLDNKFTYQNFTAKCEVEIAENN